MDYTQDSKYINDIAFSRFGGRLALELNGAVYVPEEFEAKIIYQNVEAEGFPVTIHSTSSGVDGRSNGQQLSLQMTGFIIDYSYPIHQPFYSTRKAFNEGYILVPVYVVHSDFDLQYHDAGNIENVGLAGPEATEMDPSQYSETMVGQKRTYADLEYGIRESDDLFRSKSLYNWANPRTAFTDEKRRGYQED